MFTTQQPDYEVVVIGGSYSGLSAALQLARARRHVLVIDSGRRRNRCAQKSHKETPVARIAGVAEVVLADGCSLPMAGLFVASWTMDMSNLAGQLGCAIEAGPMGEFVTMDAMKATRVSGVFSCGEMARPAGNVAFAVADGAMAGVAAQRSLIAN